MATPTNAPVRAPRAASDPEAGNGAGLMIVAAWLVPGAAHVLQGRVRKGLLFFVCLTVMFACGLAFGGRLFAPQMADPLILLAGVAQWGLGLPRILSAVLGWGAGTVTAATYEYGNTFLITSGLLNALVVLDAYDVATGRRPR